MDVLYWFESIRSPFLTGLMSAVTWLGHEILPIVVVCIFYWCVSKKTAYKMAFSFFFSGLCVQGLKITFRIDRPWILDPDFKPVESAIGAATGYSFPSGHTQAATSLYGTLAMLLKKWWAKLICVIIMLLVATSRLYLGVHTPLDVGVALAVTLVTTVIVCLVYDRLYGKKNAALIVSVIMAAMSGAILIYGIVLLNKGVIDYANVRDAFKTSGAGMAFAVGYAIERIYINFEVKAKNVGMQIVKVLCGVAPALGAYLGLKVLFNAIFTTTESMILGDFLRYFILVIWIIAVYPAIFKAVSAKKSQIAFT